MPDQSTASSEHALIQEITMPLATLPDDPVKVASDVDFPVVLRGYDRIAVDAYVKKTCQIVAELQATRAPEAAIRRALDRVGEEVSGILQRAHETASQITAQSRSEAEDRLEAARQEALQITAAAEQRVKDLDAETDRIWAERQRIVEDTRELARQLSGLADSAADRFPADEEPEAAAPDEGGAQPLVPAEDEVDPSPTPVAGDARASRPHLEPAPDDGDDVDDTLERRRTLDPAAGHVVPAPARPVAMRVIDLMHLGRDRVIGCWQVDGVLIDPGPASCLPALTEALANERPRALLLTHIHLDHACATGSLVERWPDLKVYVHEIGVPHMVDPSRLLKSARRLYGDDMDRLWGEVVPVPEANITPLQGGERLLGGAFEVAYTPGHASHHVSYRHERTAFVGDVGGVRIPPSPFTVPPTPPPDIDLEAWHESIGRVRSWQPERMAVTHFGDTDEVDAQLDELGRRLDAWAALAQEHDQEEFIAAVEAEIGPELLDFYRQAAPPDQLYMGLERYWSKRPAPR